MNDAVPDTGSGDPIPAPGPAARRVTHRPGGPRGPSRTGYRTPGRPSAGRPIPAPPSARRDSARGRPARCTGYRDAGRRAGGGQNHRHCAGLLRTTVRRRAGGVRTRVRPGGRRRVFTAAPPGRRPGGHYSGGTVQRPVLYSPSQRRSPSDRRWATGSGPPAGR
eukprot:362528-Hanusia_phi.AAC.1